MSVFKEYEMMFKLNAQMSGSYNAAFTKAQAQISAFQKEIESLGKSQANITSYQKQQSALEATRQKLILLQQQYDNIQKEIGETEGYSSALENKLLSKQQQIDKTSASIERQVNSLDRLQAELKEAGVDTESLGEETKRLDAEMDELRKSQDEVAESALKQGTLGAQAISAYQQAFVASGILNLMESLYEQITSCTDASIAFESALTGVDKTTDLSKAELSEMSEAVKDLALEIPVTTDEMLGIGEVAGQLGVAKENLLDFSTTMSMLSTSTTMAADEGATLLAQFANITQMDPSYYDELASAIVYLGNNYATTEQKIAEMSQGIAASASIAGMSEADMIGISAAVTSLGHEAQMGSTAISRLISILMTAVETGDGLTELANVAGMSAEEFSAAWGENAAGALESFIVGLNDTSRMGQSAIVTLTDLGITEARMQKVVLSLANSGDQLTQAIAASNKAWNENSALSEEAAKRYATTASQMVIFQNSVNNLQIAIGDVLTPTLRTLYAAGADVISGITEFVEANPALVRGLTATVGAIGAVTAALAAYTAVAKMAKAVTAMIPGAGQILAVAGAVATITGVLVAASTAAETEAQAVRRLTEASREEYYQLQNLQSEYEATVETYGETSEEAKRLAGEIDYLTDKYEANKQTMAEYREEAQQAADSARELLESNKEAYEEISNDEYRTLALVTRLKELASQTNQTVETQEEMKAIITELNGIVPELAFSYDDVIGGVIDYGAAIEAAVKAQAAQQKYEAASGYMIDAYNKKIDEEVALAKATDEQTAALDRYNKAYAARVAYLEAGNYDPTHLAMDQEYQDLVNAEADASDALDDANAAVEAHRATVRQATEDYQYYKDEMVGYIEVTEESTASTTALTDRINETKAEMEKLAEAYTLAYEAAYSSVSGQYSLWDEAAKVVATSTDTITSNIESQTEYWQGYNSNLQSLTERSSSIEGLSDMIASFADGSSESVNAIAGMASASDEELATMVADWQALQAEQQLVADSIAELSTNFTGEMDRLQSELEADIAAMDLNEEAAASGKNTVQGFIDGAIDMLPLVKEAYAKIAQAAKDAIDETLDINSPSREAAWRAEMTWTGFINQTKEMEPEVMNAMAEAAGAGADAVDMQLMAFAPQLIAALNGYQGSAVDAVSDTRSAPVSIQVTFQIQGDATPDVVEALDMYGNEFAERVLSIVADANSDVVRRSY